MTTSSLQLRVPVVFPATVQVSGTGLSVSKSNGVWTVALDISAVTTAAASDAAALLVSENYRVKLDANRTYYVRTDGSDSNDGLTNNSAGAFLTIQKAIDVVSLLDLGQINGGNAVKIQVADGTYTENLKFGEPVGALGATSGVQLIGNTSTPSNCVIAGHHYVNSISWQVQGFKFTCASGSTFDVDMSSFIIFSSPFEFGANTGTAPHVFAHNGSKVYLSGNYTISGGAKQHWACESGGLIRARGMTITLSGTPAFSSQFLEGQSGGTYQIDGITFSGSATGQRFFLDGGAAVYTGTSGNLTYLPGDSAGAARNGSSYDQIMGPVSGAAPNTQTGASYTVTVDDDDIIANRAGTVTLTLPTASSFPGRVLWVKTIQNQTVVSDGSNVVPVDGTAAGTAILSGTAGKWARLKSNGTNWIIMAAG